MKKATYCLVTTILLITKINFVLAYSTNVHEKITEKAAKKSVLENGDCLLNLGFSEESLETFYVTSNIIPWLGEGTNETKTILGWIQNGSVIEDDSPRPINHFYDPLTGRGLTINSLSWGEEIIPDINFQFYRYLIAESKLERETKLSLFLRGLGQEMHLIHDCAVPAHVRNDIHYSSDETKPEDTYERYTYSKRKDEQDYGTDILPYDGYDPVDIQNFNTLSKFWDWNKGGQGESAEEIYNDNSKGLAEYTNHNFVSKDTNIEDDSYEYPAKEWLTNGWFYSQPEIVTLANGSQKNIVVKYAGWHVEDKYRQDKSEDSHYMVAYSFFDFHTQQINNKRVFSLSPKVLAEQARFLIPRAVGYSAGFLNYFFRGTISVTSQPVVDNSQVTAYDLTITNTSGFDFSNGEIKIMTDTIDGTRRCMATVPISSLPDGQPISSPVTITRSNDARPLSNPQDDFTLYLDEKLTGTVLFKGKIGEEEGIAALVCPLVNVVPIMQAIDERRKFSPPEYAGDDGDWYVYKRDGSSEIIPGGYGLNAYDDGEIKASLIIDMRNAIEILKSRYWDSSRYNQEEQPWHFPGSNLYETAHQGDYDEWEKDVNALQDGKITLKEIQEVEKCILFLDEAYQPIRYTDWVPGSVSTMTNALKKAGAEAQGYTWAAAKFGAEQNAQTASLTYNSLHVCAIEGYGIKTLEYQGDVDVDLYLAGLQYARAYGKVDTSGLSSAAELRDDKLEIMLRARGSATNIPGLSYTYAVHSSSLPRTDHDAWGLSGGEKLAEEDFSGTGGWDYEQTFIEVNNVSGLSGSVQFGGYTYLMLAPEEVLKIDCPSDMKSFYQDFIFAENAAAVWSVFLYRPNVQWYIKQ